MAFTFSLAFLQRSKRLITGRDLQQRKKHQHRLLWLWYSANGTVQWNFAAATVQLQLCNCAWNWELIVQLSQLLHTYCINCSWSWNVKKCAKKYEIPVLHFWDLCCSLPLLPPMFVVEQCNCYHQTLDAAVHICLWMLSVAVNSWCRVQLSAAAVSSKPVSPVTTCQRLHLAPPL